MGKLYQLVDDESKKVFREADERCQKIGHDKMSYLFNTECELPLDLSDEARKAIAIMRVMINEVSKAGATDQQKKIRQIYNSAVSLNNLPPEYSKLIRETINNSRQDTLDLSSKIIKTPQVLMDIINSLKYLSNVTTLKLSTETLANPNIKSVLDLLKHGLASEQLVVRTPDTDTDTATCSFRRSSS